ncbi:hypothetical protein AB1N83_002993 [Pleurotus pulmonarius]
MTIASTWPSVRIVTCAGAPLPLPDALGESASVLPITPTGETVIRIFDRGQAERLYQPAPFALAEKLTGSGNAMPRQPGMVVSQPPIASTRPSCFDLVPRSASTGNAPQVARAPLTPPSISVPVADSHHMELRTALQLRWNKALTPYDPDIWQQLLIQSSLINKYPAIPRSLRLGFDLHIPPIHRTQMPPNKSTILLHIEPFRSLIQDEVAKLCYFGPLSQTEVEDLIGLFQSSLFSIMEKPTSPGKYRLLQNYSFPHETTSAFPSPSINSQINTDDFPATWGTFNTVTLIIAGLPPGAQAATRDVAEAYRTIPVMASQWPGMVVRGENDNFYIDTATCFGIGPSAGAYGNLNDAAKDLFRFHGLGPLSSWVDDYLFFRFPKVHLPSFNIARALRHSQLAPSPLLRSGGRIWYAGSTHPDGFTEEFNEDFSFPLRDCSTDSPRGVSDLDFTYTMVDIDRISQSLGIPWQTSKESPFSSTIKYIGFLWDLDQWSVILSPDKAAKFVLVIQAWLECRTHTFDQVASLHGKLIHASLALPFALPYLTILETMLAICGPHPFLPHSPPRHLKKDLQWWLNCLTHPSPPHIISIHIPFVPLNAYSDASSTGIGIVVDGRQRSWSLCQAWSTLGGARDIAWAEAVGFELLIIAITDILKSHCHVQVFGDNISIIGAWANGKSRNRPVNDVFKHIFAHLQSSALSSTVHPTYVPSASNLADPPSRGIFSSHSLLLPPIRLPDSLASFISDNTSQ